MHRGLALDPPMVWPYLIIGIEPGQVHDTTVIDAANPENGLIKVIQSWVLRQSAVRVRLGLQALRTSVV